MSPDDYDGNSQESSENLSKYEHSGTPWTPETPGIPKQNLLRYEYDGNTKTPKEYGENPGIPGPWGPQWKIIEIWIMHDVQDPS